MKHSPLRGNVPTSHVTSRNFQSAAVFQALSIPTKNAVATPMQRPFALSLTVGALLYAALSILTLVVLHDAGSNGQAMSAGYGVTASRD
jgi:hypothetical protein